LDEGLSHREKIRIVDSEHGNGGPPNGRPAGQRCPSPHEVVVPPVYPWMEEPNDLARVGICPGNVRTFMPITVKTRQGEIIENRLASMLTRNDVIDVKR